MLDYIINLPNLIIELFLKNPLAQSIGIIAFLISIINFSFMKGRNFIWGTLIASLFWGLNFFFLGAFAAAYINFVDVFKNAAALIWKKSKKALILFLIIYILIGIWNFLGINFSFETYKITFGQISYLSLIPTFTALLSTYLVFKTTGVKMKAGFLVVVATWLIYNIYFGNIGGVLTDLSLGIAGIYGIIRDLKHERKTT